MTDPAETRLAGGCTCGAVRYRLTATPLFVHCCHCTWCQRGSGSAFAVNVMIEATNVELLSGDLDRDMLPTASGQGQEFVRCAECGTTVWSHYAAAREKISFVRAGTLDDPSLAPPDIHIFTSTKQPWVALPDDVPAVPEYYQRSEYWPADCVARYKAATAA